MQDFTQAILELIRITSTDLPSAVENKLRAALAEEKKESAAFGALEAILTNVEMTRRYSTPICQDTGTPIFFIHNPPEISHTELTRQIRNAVESATQKNYLRPNAVDSLNGKNTGTNLGDRYFPFIHFYEIDGDLLTIDLILKGGGCENVGAQYSLPENHLQAGRDLEGVRKVVLDAVYRAQGEGCSPGFLGVAIGGDRGTSYLASKEAFLRDVVSDNQDEELNELEKRITKEANELEIGPMGFGGRSTILGTKIVSTHRLPASFFVTVSYMCWAYRRHSMVVDREVITYR